MNLAVIRERAPFDRRVALTPPVVRRLCGAGHTVWVETLAGEGAMYSDADYLRAGAQIAYSPEEAIGRAELLAKIGRPTDAELAWCAPHMAVLAFYHTAVAGRGLLDTLAERCLTAIACELIQQDDGRLPVLAAISELAGQMAVPIAAHLLRSSSGGRGILLAGTPGVPPARIVILGAGAAGFSAARTAARSGARVTAFDRDPRKLRYIIEHQPEIETCLADEDAIAEAVAGADIVIGAILVAGTRPPHVVTRVMVESMRKGSAVIDISIDQGGCIETSRPTTIAEPTFVHHGVTHFCVPNFTADLGRAASVAIGQAMLPYVLTVAKHGVEGAIVHCPELARGVYTLRGRRMIGDYRSRIMPADVALAELCSGQRVYVHNGCAEPVELVKALTRRGPELEDVEVLHMATMGIADYILPEYEGHFRHNALFIGGNVRQAVQEGRADYTPIFLSEIEELFTSKAIGIDVCLLQCTPPDAYGYMSLGPSIDASLTAAQCARHVIVEINDQCPRTLGDTFIHVSRVDAFVEASHPLSEYPRSPVTDLQRAIGRHVASLIPDGATIQTGIGGIPEATLGLLRDRKDLGIHSEMVPDSVVELIKAGVITGECKTVHPHKVVAGFVLGSKLLFDFINNNPTFEFHRTAYCNDPFLIAQHPKMVAINSAIEVDLTGQVCSDSMGTAPYSGIGGQVDFLRGAARSKGGLPIITLPSTARDGAVSRIVPTLRPGAGVVTSRGDVHYVITEHGIAYLHGKTIRQRAEALIAIADPKFHAELEAYARQAKLLTASRSIVPVG